MRCRYFLSCTLKLDSEQGLVNMWDPFELWQGTLPSFDTKPNIELRTDIDRAY